MILDRESLNDPAIFDYFERIILGKCAQCLPFGLRVCGVLRVSETFHWSYDNDIAIIEGVLSYREQLLHRRRVCSRAC